MSRSAKAYCMAFGMSMFMVMCPAEVGAFRSQPHKQYAPQAK